MKHDLRPAPHVSVVDHILDKYDRLASDRMNNLAQYDSVSPGMEISFQRTRFGLSWSILTIQTPSTTHLCSPCLRQRITSPIFLNATQRTLQTLSWRYIPILYMRYIDIILLYNRGGKSEFSCWGSWESHIGSLVQAVSYKCLSRQ